MTVKFVAEGCTVYELRTYEVKVDQETGKITYSAPQRIKIRECNDERSAQAVANYYNIREE